MKTLCAPFAFPGLKGTTGRSRQPFFPRPRAQNIMARIALILPRLSRYGGVEQFAFRLAEALAETRNSEHEVEFICARSECLRRSACGRISSDARRVEVHQDALVSYPGRAGA